MNRKILFCILIIFTANFTSCSKKVMKKVISLKQSTFYSNEKTLSNDSVLIQLSNAFDKAFKLPPIEKSVFTIETRIYFINPFNERFFIEEQSKDTVHTRFYNCKTRRKGNHSLNNRETDSLFMEIGGLIKLEFKQKAIPFIYFDSIPVFKNFFIATDTDGLLDDGSTYFYEIKVNNTIKKGLIDNPFQTKKNNADALYVEKFIRYINEKYSFHFWDTWSNNVTSFTFKE